MAKKIRYDERNDRILPLNPKPVTDEVGRPICIQCRGPRGTSTAFCSPDCRVEYRVRARPKDARKAVFKRDRGVCARCGVDTHELKLKIIQQMCRQIGRPTSMSATPSPLVARELLSDRSNRELLDYYVRQGYPDSLQRAWWEADHVHAVADGGAAAGLSNYQTLCYPCHRRRTADDQRERFKKR